MPFSKGSLISFLTVLEWSRRFEERLGYLVREWLHEHPELVVHHPDGTWSLREDDSVVPFKPFLQRCNNATQKTPKDPPDGAA